MQGNEKNRNGRIYPTETLVKESHRYTEEMIKAKRSLGELNHPESVQVNPERASHIITELTQDGNYIMGKAKVLDTPLGKIVKSLMDEGVTLGVSSRGFGSITEQKGHKVVGGDFHLATVDIVSDPSAPKAFVESIMENKEFFFENGILMEKEHQEIEAQIEESARQGTLDEDKLFELFKESIEKYVLKTSNR